MQSVLIAVAAVVLDQLTKWLVATRMTELAEISVIPGFFSLQYVHNTGAAFGMLKNGRWFFVAVAAAAVVGILYYLRQPEARHPLVRLSLGLIMGGAVGNMIDRIVTGRVVDFLLFYWRDYYFPNFNVADICVTVGVGLLFLHLLLTERESRA
ncbi:signal peptidase II [Symbiobacterium terraclitae]|uniref:Lipoprotein signal peptidase n=1 Tax=Symbiobacterium terraclitae TaxID=557451 RepID=A0ABS4JNL5_9FIRM|nr:signal peptidase II [Symbiobacterium terraclitae]MBP2017123.1 signal peptidase II [Symbiobacterium terraclitae]